MILSKRPEIERFLGHPDPKVRAVLIYGRDRQVVRDRAVGLAGKVVAKPDDPFDVTRLNDSDLDGDGGRLEGELTALSMMGGRRLVWLRLSAEKGALDKQVSEVLACHLAGDLNTDCFFLIEGGNLGKDSLLRKGAEKAPAAAVIPCYEDEAGDTARLVREILTRDRIAIETAALELFVARLPHERGVARQEAERLALYLGPGRTQPVTAAELEPFLGVEPEASLGEAAIDAFGGRLGAAQAHIRRAAAEGEQGPAVVRALGMHLARLRRALTLAAAGAGLQEAAKASGVFWKTEREFLRQARAWTLPMLDELQPDLLAADMACKTTGSPDRLLGERLAMTIAGKARRLGL